MKQQTTKMVRGATKEGTEKVQDQNYNQRANNTIRNTARNEGTHATHLLLFFATGAHDFFGPRFKVVRFFKTLPALSTTFFEFQLVRETR